MYLSEVYQEFEPFLDPETWLDENGHIIDWKNRSLVKNAPQSAKDAFEKFKKLEAEADKLGIIR